MHGVGEILKTAIQNHKDGNLQLAEQIYCKVIDEVPDNPIALHSLAVLAHQRNQNDIAMDLIVRAIRSDPQNSQFYNTQGLLFEALGNMDFAISSYNKAILLDRYCEESHWNLAIAYQSKGDFQNVVEKSRQIISQFGPSPKLYNLMGYSLQQQKKFSDAIKCYQQAIHLAPDFAEPYNHIAVIFNKRRQYNHAKENSIKALELDPDYAEAYNNLAVALSGLGNYGPAIKTFQKAIDLWPEYHDAYYNMGNCLQKQNRTEESIALYQKAIQINPDYARAHWNLALAFLQTGRFAQGWSEYKWRRKPSLGLCTYPHHYDQPYWDGTPFAGKRLLVHYEQGFGDNIQFARYLPMVKHLGGTVIFEVEKPLSKLFQQIAGVDEFVQASYDSISPGIDFDFHISTLDLPGMFGTTLENIPANVPYLLAEPSKVEYWRNTINNNSFNVGIVWAGSPRHQNDGNRSCPLKCFAPLTKIENLKLYSLQKGLPSEQIFELTEGMGIISIGEEFEDFTDTAAAIENMDLVISVDTSVLHLAGAMGKPVWAILPFVPDWRWMLNRDDSPWYPTMRLFRQKEPGNWDELFVRVAQQLRALVDKKY